MSTTARTAPDLVELAEDFLASRRSRSSDAVGSQSDRARRTDLATWGRTLAMFSAVDTGDLPRTRDLERDLGLVSIDDLTTEKLQRALESLDEHYATATAKRMASTMRTFCAWLVKKGVLAVDPIDEDEFRVARSDGRRLDVRGVASASVVMHAFTTDDIDRLVDAAAEPAAWVRASWPARDVAIFRVLEAAGLRASEVCALQVGAIDTTFETPILHVVRGTKGSKARQLPLPRRAHEAVEAYLGERRERGNLTAALRFRASDDLWVRPDGSAFGYDHLDHLIRRCAKQAAVTLPADTAAHGFRHHFGVELARRGVALPIIQEAMGHADPRTTSIYTKAVGAHMAAAFEDAGWL